MTGIVAVRKSALLSVLALLAVFASFAPTARAEDDDKSPAKPAPRASVRIGGVSVVLVSANDRLYAFVDRVEDNAPAADATLSVDLADGSSVTMTRLSDGFFAGPFNRAGHMQDALMVSVKSADGTGDAPTEIGYDDVAGVAAAPSTHDIKGKLAIALVAGAIGAVGALGAMKYVRGWRRRSGPSPHAAPIA